MEQQQQENPSPFQEQGNTTIQEIRGLIPLLNEAATDAEVFMATVPSKNTPELYKTQASLMGQFYRYMGRLIKNASEIIRDDSLYDELVLWWASKNITDQRSFEKGLELSEKLQQYLYDIGIKDTNKSAPLPFPFECYLSDQDGTTEQ